MPDEQRKESRGSSPPQPASPPTSAGADAAGHVIGGKGSMPDWIAELDKFLDSPPPDGN